MQARKSYVIMLFPIYSTHPIDNRSDFASAVFEVLDLSNVLNYRLGIALTIRGALSLVECQYSCSQCEFHGLGLEFTTVVLIYCYAMQSNKTNKTGQVGQRKVWTSCSYNSVCATVLYGYFVAHLDCRPVHTGLGSCVMMKPGKNDRIGH